MLIRQNKGESVHVVVNGGIYRPVIDTEHSKGDHVKGRHIISTPSANVGGELWFEEKAIQQDLKNYELKTLRYEAEVFSPRPKVRWKRKVEGTFLKVTTTELYFFEPDRSNGWQIEEVIRQWFDNYPINNSHAARDGGLVGNSKQIVSVEIVEKVN